ncbi:LytR/AlgR family response regulator transcription factor [Ferruginibacter yonginensis]|uniref:LytR/AlgR family response regulator transcription factor n=1 Tax=Ferruginibacter yonginensis TaxID=1310416 RepID=A0ABV8QTJ3_9BACT
MNILIIEDEQLAIERLTLLLKTYDEKINVLGAVESVEEAVEWLSTKTHPDLLFVDIHLADGHSFEIFKRVIVKKPIIFTTAYDQYALDAFQLYSIDYILKPITAASLANAINKYKVMVANTAQPNYKVLLNELKENIATKYKNRFFAKIGQKLFFIAVHEIAYFIADNKIVHLVSTDGKKYIVNVTMEKLEKLVDPSLFFRANRKFMVHIDAIEQVRPYDNNRLLVLIKNIAIAEDIIISREKVAAFKLWADS